MPLNPVERRKMPRLPMEVLVRVKLPNTSFEVFGETRNVSAGGIYFVTRSERLETGQELDCLLILPEKLTMAPAPILVTAHGTVLRIDRELSQERFGVALEVSGYDFSGKSENSSYALGM
ncbi:MAG TPA: PilZ domain-containing protein [Candidatus Angelobacter sp.]|jgi:hypothetical protein|nr:PilZ domain-containing protein [Candidatus Angelobacter sp.]